MSATTELESVVAKLEQEVRDLRKLLRCVAAVAVAAAEEPSEET